MQKARRTAAWTDRKDCRTYWTTAWTNIMDAIVERGVLNWMHPSFAETGQGRVLSCTG
jgi:hypothetical protein